MPSILDFIPFAKQVTGQEYSAPCPECMGTDRFRIWPEKGKGGAYWCRQCGIRGDGIAFLRTFHGMSFQDACKAMGISIQSQYSPRPQKALQQKQTAQWRKSSHTFLLQCQKNVRHPALQKRHLNAEACFTCGIDYNVQDQYPYRSAWGLRNKQGENGKLRTKIKIPQGIVIATFRKKEIVALAVRTHDSKNKYWQVKGSANVPFLVGKANTPLVLLESALSISSQIFDDYIMQFVKYALLLSRSAFTSRKRCFLRSIYGQY